MKNRFLNRSILISLPLYPMIFAQMPAAAAEFYDQTCDASDGNSLKITKPEKYQDPQDQGVVQSALFQITNPHGDPSFESRLESTNDSPGVRGSSFLGTITVMSFLVSVEAFIRTDDDHWGQLTDLLSSPDGNGSGGSVSLTLAPENANEDGGVGRFTKAFYCR